MLHSSLVGRLKSALLTLPLVTATLVGAANLPGSIAISNVPPPGMKPNGGQQPPASPQITAVTYNQNPNDPQYVTVVVSGTGNASNCFADISLGSAVHPNLKIGAFPNGSQWYAPANDGDLIRAKAVSGCTGDVSVAYKKPVIDPNVVSTITGVQTGKATYLQGESTGFTVQGTVGQSACFMRITIDNGLFDSQMVSSVKPFPRVIPNAGTFAPGLHTITVDGTPNAPGAPPCKGSVSTNFKVESSDANAAKITSVTIANPPFVVGQAQYVTVNGSGSCQYRLEYSDGFKTNIMASSAANPFPHKVNVHPIYTPGNYVVTAVTLNGCNGGSGAGFTVVQ